MGACMGTDKSNHNARLRSEAIDRELMQMAKEDEHIVKILLLGAGESGKSTLVKQMKIIHSDGFTHEELKKFKPAILNNLLSSMKYVLNGMGLLRIPLSNTRNKSTRSASTSAILQQGVSVPDILKKADWSNASVFHRQESIIYAQAILQCHRCFDEHWVMRPSIATALLALWSDLGVRACVSRGNEYQLNDSALYYFEHIERIASENYIPNNTDVLRARVRTTGIIETHFKINGVIFRMYDVGGQRSERRKWIQCFDDVKALLFVAALNGYDMTLFEDPEVNRLRESIRLFGSICNNCFFNDTTIILFLNKVDLFQEKILHTNRHLRYYFKDFEGADRDVEAAANFVREKFQATKRNPRKVIYPHFTTATDTSNVEVVFQVIVNTIVRENLQRADLY